MVLRAGTKKLILKLFGYLIIIVTIRHLWQRFHAYYPPKPLEIRAPSLEKYLIRYETNYWRPEKIKKILVWTTFFDVWNWFYDNQPAVRNCPARCDLTRSQSDLNTSHALVFHASDYWKLSGSEMPRFRHPSQIWVMFSHEATPAMSGGFPAHLFNWTISYRRDSTIFAPYGSYAKKTSTELYNTSDDVIDYFATKSKLAVIQVSNCQDTARRYKIIHELSKHIKVDQFGQCPGKILCKKGEPFQKCVQLLKPYKFYLAFENSYCRDYITEKYWQSQMDRLQIPVVAASRATLELLPPHSYLNVFDFPTLKDLANKMLEISNDAALYNSYFEWKKYYKEGGWNYFCDLCKALHQNRTAQSYDLEAWMKHDSCSKPNFISEIMRVLDRMLFDWGL